MPINPRSEDPAEQVWAAKALVCGLILGVMDLTGGIGSIRLGEKYLTVLLSMVALLVLMFGLQRNVHNRVDLRAKPPKLIQMLCSKWMVRFVNATLMALMGFWFVLVVATRISL